ncbi:MAG: S16 family serine protease [Bacilli bacterium]
MLNKIYVKIKTFLKENFIYIIFLILITCILNINLPYYINAPGKLINVQNKVKIENAYPKEGTFNMTYVMEYDAKIITMLIARFNRNWKIEKKSDIITSNEDEKTINVRNHILMDEGNQNAIIYAYNLAHKEIIINNSKIHVTYIDEMAETNLKVGDVINKVNGKIVHSKEEIKTIINENDDLLKIETNNGTKTAKIKKIDDTNKIFVMLSTISEIKTNPKVEFKFKNNESGSSGGLMTTLYIYNSLIKEDLTKGKKIAGTGTIDINGNVGEIGGVTFKLIGAVKEKADIFFVPKENYEEAINLKTKNNYKIDIVKVETFKDSLNYLQSFN